MISLFRRFQRVDFMERAIAIWTDGDAHMAELAQVAQELRRTITAGGLDRQRLDDSLTRIRGIDTRLTTLERAFTATLSEASRTTATLLTTINILIAVALVLLAMERARRLTSQRGLFEAAARARSASSAP
jgi:hypothetical protein